MFLQTQRYQQVHTGDCCGTRARNHHPHVGDVFLHHAQAVEDGGSADNCRAVLIVVEYRNIHPLAQFLFNIETFWRFNVFEVDAAEGRFERSDDFNKFVRVEFINFNVKYINPGEFQCQIHQSRRIS